MMLNSLKRVTILIKWEDFFFYKSQALDPFIIEYHPSFDPNDFFAAARLIYQNTSGEEIQTIEQYSELLFKEEFRELLGVITKSTIIESISESKIILIEHNCTFGFQSNEIPELLKKRKEQQQYKRFALLITEPQYYLGWINIIEALHLGIYKQENEDWEIKMAFKQEFPDLTNLNGIVLTGSSSAAYDTNENWKEPLYRFLQEADQKKIKLLGICFGHQILSHCLGGRAEKMLHVPYMQCGRRALCTSLQWKGITIDYLNVYILHGDHVAKLAPSLKSIFQAEHCENYGTRNDHILSFQFHPEYNPVVLLYSIKAFKDIRNKQIFLDICNESFKNGQDHQFAIWDYAINFLKD